LTAGRVAILGAYNVAPSLFYPLIRQQVSPMINRVEDQQMKVRSAPLLQFILPDTTAPGKLPGKPLAEIINVPLRFFRSRIRLTIGKRQKNRIFKHLLVKNSEKTHQPTTCRNRKALNDTTEATSPSSFFDLYGICVLKLAI